MNFIQDLKYLSEYYRWDNVDKKEIWEITKECKETQHFFTRLANAHKSGYIQTESNNWMRLTEFENLDVCQ